MVVLKRRVRSMHLIPLFERTGQAKVLHYFNNRRFVSGMGVLLMVAFLHDSMAWMIHAAYAKEVHPSDLSHADSPLGLVNPTSLRNDQDTNPTPEHLEPQDRLTLIGGTMIERLQSDGRLEAALYQSLGSNQFQIRNLGWSGDDVWGTARAVFGQPSDGFERLKSDLKLTQPTVVLVAYGANESFAGAEGLENFKEGLRRLLDMIHESSGRPILVTPPPFEELGPPLPSMQIANENLGLYCRAIREVANDRKLAVIDLNSMFPTQPKSTRPRTENGVHLTEAGALEVSKALAQELLGRSVPDELWTRLNSATDLLAMIRKKNEWFFHRYRPQNETYLFLFRKHEQGNNALEIPQFDELVSNIEQEIRRTAIGLIPR